MKRNTLLLILLLILGAGIFVVSQLNTTTSSLPVNHDINPVVANKDTTLFFVGDIMLDRGVKSSVIKNFNGDYDRLFENVSPLKEADILFGNLEGPVTEHADNVGSQYSFQMDPKVLLSLSKAGFDIVSFANNHVGDRNIQGFSDTLENLQKNNIEYIGAGMTKNEAEYVKIIERNGIRFGFIGFSDVGPAWIEAKETSSGILLASDPRLPEIIKNAKEKTDVLIVSFHWGTEYEKKHNARQEILAHTAVDNGADMVIGHHPHVMQDIETYNGKPIVYSLGNFIFDQYTSKDTMHGMLFEATFFGKDLKETHQKVIELNRYYQPMGIYNTNDPIVKQTAVNPCPEPKKKYEDYSYLNVDQNVPIPDKTYIPSDLVLLDKSISTTHICLKKDASIALKEMFESAKKDGYILKVTSGFRSYETQKAILAQNIKNGNPNALIAVAKPGYSEHQLGVAVDLTSPSIANASAAKKFEDTKEAQWLKDNGYLYGFVLSYPEGRQEETGYMYEAWHYRYLGPEYALQITQSGETINQFLSKIKTP
jgi:LAS superfamily LD-carboxypeptidase LdcB